MLQGKIQKGIIFRSPDSKKWKLLSARLLVSAMVKKNGSSLSFFPASSSPLHPSTSPLLFVSLCWIQLSGVAISPALHIALRWSARSTALQAMAILVIRWASAADSPSCAPRGTMKCAHIHSIARKNKLRAANWQTGSSKHTDVSWDTSCTSFTLVLYPPNLA